MALRDQPYLPLYIQDLLTDEKLILCSAEAHGVYLRLLCLLHKQNKYGKIQLKNKFKHSLDKFKNFTSLLVKQMPFDFVVIEKSLRELSDEDVIQISEKELAQKRMIKDEKLSSIRARVGQKGGKKTAENIKKLAKAKSTAKHTANTENENENENKDINNINDGVKFSDDSIEIFTAKYLYGKILQNDPGFKKPDFQKWAVHIEKLIRIDKRDPETIGTVIDWCQSDQFWKGNILSTSKLRDKFPQLYAKMPKHRHLSSKTQGNVQNIKEAMEELRNERRNNERRDDERRYDERRDETT